MSALCILLLSLSTNTAFQPPPFLSTARQRQQRRRHDVLYERANDDERANYLTVADEAWNRFFRPAADSNDDADNEANDVNGKEDYFKMAMEAWDRAARNNNNGSDDAALNSNGDDRRTNNNSSSTQEKSSLLDSAMNLINLWGNNSNQKAQQEDGRMPTKTASSREQDEVPYGLRMGKSNPYSRVQSVLDEAETAKKLTREQSANELFYANDGEAVRKKEESFTKNTNGSGNSQGDESSERSSSSSEKSSLQSSSTTTIITNEQDPSLDSVPFKTNQMSSQQSPASASNVKIKSQGDEQLLLTKNVSSFREPTQNNVKIKTNHDDNKKRTTTSFISKGSVVKKMMNKGNNLASSTVRESILTSTAMTTRNTTTTATTTTLNKLSSAPQQSLTNNKSSTERPLFPARSFLNSLKKTKKNGQDADTTTIDVGVESKEGMTPLISKGEVKIAPSIQSANNKNDGLPSNNGGRLVMKGKESVYTAGSTVPSADKGLENARIPSIQASEDTSAANENVVVMTSSSVKSSNSPLVVKDDAQEVVDDSLSNTSTSKQTNDPSGNELSSESKANDEIGKDNTSSFVANGGLKTTMNGTPKMNSFPKWNGGSDTVSKLKSALWMKAGPAMKSLELKKVSTEDGAWLKAKSVDSVAPKMYKVDTPSNAFAKNQSYKSALKGSDMKTFDTPSNDFAKNQSNKSALKGSDGVGSGLKMKLGNSLIKKGLGPQQFAKNKIETVDEIVTADDPALANSDGVLKSNASFDGGIKMKLGGSSIKKGLELKQPTKKNKVGTSSVLKGSSSGPKSKTIFGIGGLKMKNSPNMKAAVPESTGDIDGNNSIPSTALGVKVGGPPQKKTFTPKQSTYDAKSKSTIGLKGNVTSGPATSFGVGKLKMNGPPTMKASQQTESMDDASDATSSSPILKGSNVGLKDGLTMKLGGMPQKKAFTPKQSNFSKVGFMMKSSDSFTQLNGGPPSFNAVKSKDATGGDITKTITSIGTTKSTFIKSKGGVSVVKGFAKKQSTNSYSMKSSDTAEASTIEPASSANADSDDLTMTEWDGDEVEEHIPSTITDSDENSFRIPKQDYYPEDIVSVDDFEVNEDAKSSIPSQTNVDENPDIASDIDFESALQYIDDESLPTLLLASRIKSNTVGLTHRGYLILAKDDGAENGYSILPCTAKRPWTVSEIKENIIADRQEVPEDWEVQMSAKTMMKYFEVEYHCYQKIDEVKQLRILQRRQAEADREKNGQVKSELDTAADSFDIFDVAVMKLLGVYQDQGSSDSDDEDVWGQSIGKEREWMVFAGGGIDGAESTLDEHVTLNQNGSHHLHSIQTALNLPEWYRFGDVMDVISRSLLENLVFLSSCNIVHRNINLSNLNCDYVNQRFQLTNFGGAVDLDPKEGKRIGLDTPPSNNFIPGSIANSIAEDTCATALVLVQLLFNLMDDTAANNFQEQIKSSSYDLDAWLKSQMQMESSGNQLSPEDIPALEYLGERRGFWGLLKRMVQPNPMKRKLAVDSLKELKEIFGLRDGTVKWTDDFIVKVATEESYLETLIDKFGASEDEVNASSDDNLDDVDDDTSVEPHQQSRVDDDASINSEVQQTASTKSIPQSKPKRDVYYDITRSKLTSKYPLTKPSALSSLLPRVKSASPPATATEIAAQETSKVYDITRASLGAANPYSNVLPMKNERELPKGVANVKEDVFSNRGYDANTRVMQASSQQAESKPPIVVSPEKIDEMSRWLLSYLPRLQQQDLQFYTNNLISDGFDSTEMLKTLSADDLVFMKKGHKRVLTRKLEVERKLDFELDPSSRKRIEMLVGASSKKISEINKVNTLPSSDEGSLRPLLAKESKSTTALAYDIFEAEEEMEETKDWVDDRIKQLEKKAQNRYLSPKALSSQLQLKNVTNISSSSGGLQKNPEKESLPPTDYDIIGAGKEFERIEAWIDEQNKIIEERRPGRTPVSSTELSDADTKSKRVPLSDYDIVEAGKECQRIEAWIDEQNKMIEERRIKRLSASQGGTSDTRTKSTQRQLSEYDIIEAGKELETIKAWIEEQNELVKKRQADRSRAVEPTVQSNHGANETVLNAAKEVVCNGKIKDSVSDEVELPKSEKDVDKTSDFDEDDRTAWYEEQNRLVEERRIARLEAERRLKEEEA